MGSVLLKVTLAGKLWMVLSRLKATTVMVFSSPGMTSTSISPVHGLHFFSGALRTIRSAGSSLVLPGFPALLTLAEIGKSAGPSLALAARGIAVRNVETFFGERPENWNLVIADLNDKPADAYEGRFALVMQQVGQGNQGEALREAWSWREQGLRA